MLIKKLHIAIAIVQCSFDIQRGVSGSKSSVVTRGCGEKDLKHYESESIHEAFLQTDAVSKNLWASVSLLNCA